MVSNSLSKSQCCGSFADKDKRAAMQGDARGSYFSSLCLFWNILVHLYAKKEHFIQFSIKSSLLRLYATKNKYLREWQEDIIKYCSKSGVSVKDWYSKFSVYSQNYNNYNC